VSARRPVTYTETPIGCRLCTSHRCNAAGRPKTQCRLNGQARWVFFDKLAYEAVHGPLPPRYTVRATCGTRGCINPEHLEAVPKAEVCGQNRVTRRYAEIVRQSGEPAGKLARAYSLTPNAVYGIRTGRSWKHLGPPVDPTAPEPAIDGPELRRRREAAGYTLQSLADAIGVDQSFLSYAERGVRGLSAGLAQHALDIFATAPRPDRDRPGRSSFPIPDRDRVLLAYARYGSCEKAGAEFGVCGPTFAKWLRVRVAEAIP
jgi:transcriptional regulator with XRE-family HTH domain